MARSRLRTAASAASLMLSQHGISADNSVLTEMDFGKMRVGIGELELNRVRGFGPAAADLRKRVFEAVRHVDPGAVLGLGHRIEDRLAAAFGDAVHCHATPTGSDVALKIDRRKNRRMHLLEGGREDVEDCCSRLGILSAENAKQGTALCFARSFVDDDGGFALAFVNRAGPAEDSDKFQTVELGRTVRSEEH